MEKENIAYVWRDAHDKDMFHFGYKVEARNRYYHWFSCHADAFDDLFNLEFDRRDVTTEPQKFVISMRSV